MKKYTICILLFISMSFCFANRADKYLSLGLVALQTDSEARAIEYYGKAYELAYHDKDVYSQAEALLHLGMCTYGSGITQGMEYAMRAMELYKQFEITDPYIAQEGRSKCLQLISTIQSRQGKHREAIALSKEAINGFPNGNDSSGTLVLIYRSLGNAYDALQIKDSAEYFHRLALKENIKSKYITYLPGSYLSVAKIEITKGNKNEGMILLDSAYQISQRSYNKQAMVLVLLEKANWEIKFNSDYQKAEAYYKEALISSENFSDKFFTIKTLDKLINLKESQKQFDEALIYEKQQIKVKEQMASYEKEKAIESLQMQFNVSEKDRKLHLIEQENEIIKLTNILLWGGIAIIIAIAIAVIQFLRKINNRNKQLLQTKEALMQAIEEQKRLKENQLQNDLDHKESQLSALALQMLRKNELLQELNEKLEQQSQPEARQLISRELNREKEWDDFNLYFEGLNKNFFNRLKEAFPEITPNDLRICALIKMNMSIKEMAAIMNISADSVKTARYRLRKKLQLNTEDNLTEFLMKL